MSYRTIHMPPSGHEGAGGEHPPAELPLDPVEVRVLGVLVEKAITTPDYYPLTLNSLVTACNQKTNRDPVTAYDDATVRDALESLRAKHLSRVVTSADARVPKYKHSMPEALQLNSPQTAMLCALMLRGPQTVGELRERAGRMYEFASLAEAQEVLDELATREPEPLCVRLARQAGMKEPRYAHLLSGPVADLAGPDEPQAASSHSRAAVSEERIAGLEREVASLKDSIESLQEEFQRFRRQFE
jgi:uncharacterized protein